MSGKQSDIRNRIRNLFESEDKCSKRLHKMTCIPSRIINNHFKKIKTSLNNDRTVVIAVRIPKIVFPLTNEQIRKRVDFCIRYQNLWGIVKNQLQKEEMKTFPEGLRRLWTFGPISTLIFWTRLQKVCESASINFLRPNEEDLNCDLFGLFILNKLPLIWCAIRQCNLTITYLKLDLLFAIFYVRRLNC